MDLKVRYVRTHQVSVVFDDRIALPPVRDNGEDEPITHYTIDVNDDDDTFDIDAN